MVLAFESRGVEGGSLLSIPVLILVNRVVPQLTPALATSPLPPLRTVQIGLQLWTVRSLSVEGVVSDFGLERERFQYIKKYLAYIFGFHYPYIRSSIMLFKFLQEIPFAIDFLAIQRRRL